MATWLDGYLNGIKSEMSNIETEVKSLLLERKDEIKQLIKERWEQGKRPNGDIIGTYRSAEYAIFKQQINPLAGGDVDLIYNRDLVGHIDLLNTTLGAEIISTDWKFREIANKYGYDNFNITDEQTDIILSEIAVQVINNIFKKVWG